jgi:hypothetical protein
MSSDESNADLLQELRRKFEAAVRLSRDDFKQELKPILKNAFFSYEVKGGKNNLIWMKDPEDPQSWKAIEGKDERDTVEKAIWCHLEFLAAAMAPHIRRNFKPVAVFARRWLLSDPFSEMLNDAPHSIITCLFENQDWLERLCKFFCYPEVAAIRERFQGMLAEELDLVLCDAELATASPLSDQDNDVDAITRRALAPDPAPNGVPAAEDDKEKKRIAVMNKINDPRKNHPFIRLDEAAAVLGLGTTRAVQKRINDKDDPLERGPHDGTVSMDSVRKALKIRN